tara:strand:- start:247 stop:726 length:480 start_codon:yes stop_codon:yes gene_type:complete
MLAQSIREFFEYIKKIILEKKLIIASCFVIFIVIAAVFYFKYIKPYLERKYVNNREFLPKKDENKISTLYFFYTDWCPLSKKAMVEWNAFKQETGDSLNGINIDYKDINCDQDTETADLFKITGYPTIKLVYNDKIYEYDAKPDRVVLNKFLNEIFTNP